MLPLSSPRPKRTRLAQHDASSRGGIYPINRGVFVRHWKTPQEWSRRCWRMTGVTGLCCTGCGVPSVDGEGSKRPLRERQRPVKERTALTNAIKGLLKLIGIFDLEPRRADFDAAFAAVTTACREQFPPQARREIERLAEWLGLVLQQVEVVEAKRDEAVRAGRIGPPRGDGWGSATRKRSSVPPHVGILSNKSQPPCRGWTLQPIKPARRDAHPRAPWLTRPS